MNDIIFVGVCDVCGDIIYDCDNEEITCQRMICAGKYKIKTYKEVM